LKKIWLEAAITYGVAHAQHVLLRFDDLFKNLDRFPLMGREHVRLRGGTRYFPLKDYPFTVFFSLVPTGIRIVRILHSKALPERHL